MDKVKLHDEMLDLELSILELSEELTKNRLLLQNVKEEIILKRTKKVLSDMTSEIESYQEYVEEKLSDFQTGGNRKIFEMNGGNVQ